MSTLALFKRLGGQLMLGPRGELGFVTDWQTFQIDGELTRTFANYSVQYIKEYAANLNDHRFRVALIYNSTQKHPWGSETLRFTDEVVRMIYPMSAMGSNELTTFQKKKRENSIHYGTELLLGYALKDIVDAPIFLPVLFDRHSVLGQYDQTSATVLLSEPPDTPVLEVLNLLGPPTAARKNLDIFTALKQQLERTLIKKDARRPVEMKIMENARAATTPTLNPPRPPPAPSAPTFTGTLAGISGPALSSGASAQWYNPALHDATCEKLSRFLTQPRAYADVEQVRLFTRFRDLTMSQQKEIAVSCPLYLAPTKALLMERGSTDQWNLFLLQGQLELIAADGEKKIVDGGTDSARNAIAALKPRKFSVTALTPVRFLWIHENIVAEIQQQQSGPKLELV